MRTLAIETTGEEKSIALGSDGVLVAETSFGGDLLTEFWKRLDGFLEENNVKIKDIDCFAVNAGPGSWTGLRFGVSVVKGWAAATGKKVLAMTAAEIQASALPSHTPAATLACRCQSGVNPEELVPVYGHLPKFRKLND